MKSLIQKLAILVACAALASQAYSQVLISDDFNDGTINSSLWNVSLPFGDASVSESSGILTSTNRGHLISTATNISGPLTIETRVKLSGFNSALNLMWNSNGVLSSGVPTNGFGFSLYAESQRVGVGIINVTPNVEGVNWVNTSVPLDTWIDVKITDSGSQLAVYLNGSQTPIATATYTAGEASTGTGGGKIDFLSRENIFNTHSASMDYITVTAVPEPSTYAAVFGACALGFVAYRRHRLKKAA